MFPRTRRPLNLRRKSQSNRKCRMSFESLERREMLAFTDGNALLLDGIDDEARAPHNATLNVGDSIGEGFTLEASAYVPTDSLGGVKTLFYKNNSYRFYVNFQPGAADVVLLGIYNGFQWISVFGSANLDQGWHHLAAVYENSDGGPDTFSIYADGQRIATTSGVGFSPGIPTFTRELGVGGYFGGGLFTGALDEVRVSNIARYTGSSITVPNSRHSADANTMALWHFDEAEGATAFADGSSSGNSLGGLNGARAGLVVVDAEPPRVTSIVRLMPAENPTAAAQVTYRVAFSELVGNVSTADFTLVDLADSIVGESIASVSSSSGTTIDVTINTGTAGNGELRLDVLASTATITDVAVNPLQENFTGGQSFLIERPVPEVSIDDVQILEGNQGEQVAVFTLSLSAPSWPGAWVFYDTLAGTASHDDYGGIQGTVFLNEGQTSAMLTVPIYADNRYEADETFFLRLTQSGNLHIARDQGIGTILNDDPAPSASLSLAHSELAEAGGTTTVTVSLSIESDFPVTADLVFRGAAILGDDYVASAQSILIPARSLEGSVVLTALDDALFEGHESIIIEIVGLQNATPADPQQVIAKILENEPVPGDTNDDGVVDLDDLNNVRNAFGGPGGLGDTDGDGDVDLDDLNAVRNYFGASLEGGISSTPTELTAEPRASQKRGRRIDDRIATDMVFTQWFDSAESPGRRRPRIF